ncbi:hypothetical protein ACFL2Q_00255 [Thermodesulfobacteriota bacterium]
MKHAIFPRNGLLGIVGTLIVILMVAILIPPSGFARKEKSSYEDKGIDEPTKPKKFKEKKVVFQGRQLGIFIIDGIPYHPHEFTKLYDALGKEIDVFQLKPGDVVNITYYTQGEFSEIYPFEYDDRVLITLRVQPKEAKKKKE